MGVHVCEEEEYMFVIVIAPWVQQYTIHVYNIRNPAPKGL